MAKADMVFWPGELKKTIISMQITIVIIVGNTFFCNYPQITFLLPVKEDKIKVKIYRNDHLNLRYVSTM
jgi:hypothetical protein